MATRDLMAFEGDITPRVPADWNDEFYDRPAATAAVEGISHSRFASSTGEGFGRSGRGAV